MPFNFAFAPDNLFHRLGFTCLPLSVKRVELKVEIMIDRFAGVDRTSEYLLRPGHDWASRAFGVTCANPVNQPNPLLRSPAGQVCRG